MPVGSFTEIATCNAVQCLAQLPNTSYLEVSINAFLGGPTTDPWNTLPITVKDVATATKDDKVYGKLLLSIHLGRLDNNDGNLKPFVSIFRDLHIEKDIIFFGS